MQKIRELLCRVLGHKMEVEDGVCGDYQALPDDGLDHGTPKLVDIDCGVVSWYCTRCGQGGRAYF